jgi:hypothetical protein
MSFSFRFLERMLLERIGPPLVALAALTRLSLSVYGCGAIGGSAEPLAPADEDAVASEDGNRGGAPDAIGLGNTCVPGDVSGFLPVYNKPTGPYVGACTPDQLASLVTDCFADSATKARCDGWIAASSNTQCSSCWAGLASSTSGAPVLYPEPGAPYVINEGACIALSDPSALTCAQETEYAFECQLAACVPFCPITGDAAKSDEALTNCFETAASGGCSTYGPSVDACQNVLVGGPAYYCRNATDPEAHPLDLLHYLEVACGAPPADGGAEPEYDSGVSAVDASLEDTSAGDASTVDAPRGDAPLED